MFLCGDGDWWACWKFQFVCFCRMQRKNHSIGLPSCNCWLTNWTPSSDVPASLLVLGLIHRRVAADYNYSSHTHTCSGCTVLSDSCVLFWLSGFLSSSFLQYSTVSSAYAIDAIRGSPNLVLFRKCVSGIWIGEGDCSPMAGLCLGAQEQAIMSSALSRHCWARQGHYTFVAANFQYALDFVL